MILGLRGKILLIAVLVVTLTVMAITLVAGRVFSSAYSQAVSGRAEAISHEVATQFSRLLALGLHAEEIVGFDDQCIKAYESHADLAYVAVATPAGEILFHSTPSRVGQQLPDERLRTALAAGREAVIQAEGESGAIMAALMPINDPSGQFAAVAVVAHAQSALDAQLRALYLNAAGVGGLFMVFGLLILFWAISRFVSRPLAGVVNAVDVLRKQSPDAAKRIDVVADGELHVLVDGFNSLLLELEARQQALLGAKEQALAASRAKTEFLATVSHELRTPLNGVLGMNSLLLMSDLNDKQRRYATLVGQSGNTLLRLIEEILDFSAIESGSLRLEVRPFALRESLSRVVGGLETLAQDKGLNLVLEVAENCTDRLTGDERRLEQVLINLLGNAIKFTEQGFVCLRVTPGAGCLQFEVEDSGIGIDPGMQVLIFEPFRQADGSFTRKYGGTGLGLAITARLVKAMGGDIGLQSEAGKGSVFRFRLPVAAQQAA